MKFIFEQYIQIQSDKRLTRDLRNAKTDELLKAQDYSSITFAELFEFDIELDKLKINFTFPFFKHVFLPGLEKGFRENNLIAIKLLIKHFQVADYIQRKSSTVLYFYWDLLGQGLAVSPDDEELLKNKESALQSHLEYAVHEIPAGLLFDYGVVATTVSQCETLMNDLDEYKQICKRLGVDTNALIQEYEFHFHHYRQYLIEADDSLSYEKYLDKQP